LFNNVEFIAVIELLHVNVTLAAAPPANLAPTKTPPSAVVIEDEPLKLPDEKEPAEETA
jgi:hypothetical protein